MSTRIRKPRRRSPVSRQKVVERRGQVLEGLLDSAGKLMAERGVGAVSVEQILLAAGISRGTFYGYFSNKSELVAALLKPVLVEGADALERLADQAPQTVVPGIIDLYLDLWSRHREALLIIPSVDGPTFARLKADHVRYTEAMREALDRAATADVLRNGSATYTFRVLTRTAVPLLRVYQDHPDLEQLYRDSLLALLVAAD